MDCSNRIYAGLSAVVTLLSVFSLRKRRKYERLNAAIYMPYFQLNIPLKTGLYFRLIMRLTYYFKANK